MELPSPASPPCAMDNETSSAVGPASSETRSSGEWRSVGFTHTLSHFHNLHPEEGPLPAAVPPPATPPVSPPPEWQPKEGAGGAEEGLGEGGEEGCPWWPRMGSWARLPTPPIGEGPSEAGLAPPSGARTLREAPRTWLSWGGAARGEDNRGGGGSSLGCTLRRPLSSQAAGPGHSRQCLSPSWVPSQEVGLSSPQGRS